MWLPKSHDAIVSDAEAINTQLKRKKKLILKIFFLFSLIPHLTKFLLNPTNEYLYLREERENLLIERQTNILSLFFNKKEVFIFL